MYSVINLEFNQSSTTDIHGDPITENTLFSDIPVSGGITHKDTTTDLSIKDVISYVNNNNIYLYGRPDDGDSTVTFTPLVGDVRTIEHTSTISSSLSVVFGTKMYRIFKNGKIVSSQTILNNDDRLIEIGKDLTTHTSSDNKYYISPITKPVPVTIDNIKVNITDVSELTQKVIETKPVEAGRDFVGFKLPANPTIVSYNDVGHVNKTYAEADNGDTYGDKVDNVDIVGTKVYTDFGTFELSPGSFTLDGTKIASFVNGKWVTSPVHNATWSGSTLTLNSETIVNEVTSINSNLDGLYKVRVATLINDKNKLVPISGTIDVGSSYTSVRGRTKIISGHSSISGLTGTYNGDGLSSNMTYLNGLVIPESYELNVTPLDNVSIVSENVVFYKDTPSETNVIFGRKNYVYSFPMQQVESFGYSEDPKKYVVTNKASTIYLSVNYTTDARIYPRHMWMLDYDHLFRGLNAPSIRNLLSTDVFFEGIKGNYSGANLEGTLYVKGYEKARELMSYFNDVNQLVIWHRAASNASTLMMPSNVFEIGNELRRSQDEYLMSSISTPVESLTIFFPNENNTRHSYYYYTVFSTSAYELKNKNGSVRVTSKDPNVLSLNTMRYGLEINGSPLVAYHDGLSFTENGIMGEEDQSRNLQNGTNHYWGNVKEYTWSNIKTNTWMYYFNPSEVSNLIYITFERIRNGN